MRPREKRRVGKTAKMPPPLQDRERAFLDDVAGRFDAELSNEDLDAGAYDRVLSYLTQRYGSEPEAA
jgi:hypothetical protein